MDLEVEQFEDDHDNEDNLSKNLLSIDESETDLPAKRNVSLFKVATV